MTKLTDCKLEQYRSISEWITAQQKVINDLAISDIAIDDVWQKFYILSNLPNNDEWRKFVSTLKLTEKADKVANITSHLQLFEATRCSTKGLSPDTALFVMKKGHGPTSNTKGESRSQKSQGIMCHGCGEKGYIQPKCRNKDKWASYAEKKSKVDANLASTELTPAANTESFLFSIIKEDTVITVNVATGKQPADYWIFDTGATNHVTVRARTPAFGLIGIRMVIKVYGCKRGLE